MFERFNGTAQRIMAQAEWEARVLGHPNLQGFHLLLGLVTTEPNGYAYSVLSAKEVNKPKLLGIRHQIKWHDGPEATELLAPTMSKPGSDLITSAEILLALLKENHTEENTAQQALRKLEISIPGLRRAVADKVIESTSRPFAEKQKQAT